MARLWVWRGDFSGVEPLPWRNGGMGWAAGIDLILASERSDPQWHAEPHATQALLEPDRQVVTQECCYFPSIILSKYKYK